MPLWMARDQGFFAKYGIESEPVLLRNGAFLVTGMASGDVQIGRTAGAAVLSAVSAGHDLKMLATFSSRNSYDVVARPNIKRAEDIRGKKSRSIASAAALGSAPCYGSSILVSSRSATIFFCNRWAIRACSRRLWKSGLVDVVVPRQCL